VVPGVPKEKFMAPPSFENKRRQQRFLGNENLQDQDSAQLRVTMEDGVTVLHEMRFLIIRDPGLDITPVRPVFGVRNNLIELNLTKRNQQELNRLLDCYESDWMYMDVAKVKLRTDDLGMKSFPAPWHIPAILCTSAKLHHAHSSDEEVQ